MESTAMNYTNVQACRLSRQKQSSPGEGRSRNLYQLSQLEPHPATRTPHVLSKTLEALFIDVEVRRWQTCCELASQEWKQIKYTTPEGPGGVRRFLAPVE